MAIIRFPYEPESNHPQYLWNEQEYIIRMLAQNAIGVGINEGSSSVTVSLQPNNSMNFVANGPAYFPNNLLSANFNTNQTKWVYLKLDASSFYLSATQPKYNQYLHGWYNESNGDRAVIFIDSEQDTGHRCFVLDSYNSHYDYNKRINDTNNDLKYSYTNYGNFTTDLLAPGKYRIHLRGGRGGKGGDTVAVGNVSVLYGGQGALPDDVILKITIFNAVELTGYIGAAGSDGGNGNAQGLILDQTNNRYCAGATSGGGGSSGEDSELFVTGNNNLLLRAVGGAGGGGAWLIAPRWGEGASSGMPGGTINGAGGGGAGDPGNGTNAAVQGQVGGFEASMPQEENFGGKPGTLDKGGIGRPSSGAGWSYSFSDGRYVWNSPHLNNTGSVLVGNGQNGQDRDNLKRRNGGNSPGLAVSIYPDITLPTVKGGDTINTSGTHGHIYIYRTGDIIT